MRIGILSDIHVDINLEAGSPVMDGLKSAITAKGLDKMIIAGDMASDYELTLACLHELEDATGVACLFVPGNHDIWNECHPDITAWDAYDQLKSFTGNLANGPRRLDGDWVAIGDIGWYDYSFGSPEFSTEEFDRMKIDGRLWQDKVKAVWGCPTIEMHRYFFEKLEKQLQAHRNRKIILVLHVLPLQYFTVPEPNRMWSYLNAFLGSAQYGELALEYDVRYVLCGHVHYRKQTRIHNTEFICNCLNYSDQWIKDDPAEEIADVLKIIDIN
ncbi:MAG: metallophosphoesterase family protein [Deltaproteobacteria bacterium]|nr:metallophosphoesterase family protein [Deltaproteobacteria bacterium]MBW2679095.1 metallophosphoesterase family protein [Deltaproteobacteria bacterium]